MRPRLVTRCMPRRRAGSAQSATLSSRHPADEETREMIVKLAPITDADKAAVADFLHANFDERVPWARSYMALPWKVDAPNHGFMLRDGHRVVGAYLAFYSERLIAGGVERFCNLGARCVLPEYRFHSVRLLKALLAQDGYHFTDLSPNKTVESVNARFKFRHLD